MATDPTTIARTMLATMQQGWNDADGQRFAAAFSPGADFVDIRGAHHHGREAIAHGHQAIFDTVYAGSTVTYSLTHARAITQDVVLGHGRATLEAPSGPLAGTNHTTLSVVISETAGDWLVDAFHNTLVPPPDHGAA